MKLHIVVMESMLTTFVGLYRTFEKGNSVCGFGGTRGKVGRTRGKVGGTRGKVGGTHEKVGGTRGKKQQHLWMTESM